MELSMGHNLFHNCKLLFPLDFRFEINVNDGNFYNYGKVLNKLHNLKGTELCVKRFAKYKY